ncbi:MAG: aspartyl/asparaginyl beta-hydroxylase domain-containing protein [Acidobacteria bacterium]|nr:aspartyl/asparaginyl beta-hydroxylase domain-containing protein [Acidobacteriota bacterium]
MVAALKLPYAFDPAALRADLRAVGADEWVPHFNQQYYEGGWSGVALRANGGASSRLLPDPARRLTYDDTPLLDRCPYFREVLRAFECPLESVRLLRLGAGSRILEHRDFDLGFRYNTVRVHVPVLTNPEVEFYLDGERVSMAEGETWYLDLSLPHRVSNGGASDRIHLVIDCVVNEWVRGLLGNTER